VIRELGEKAVVVNVQKNEPAGGFLRIGKKTPSFEVVVAVEESVDADSSKPGTASTEAVRIETLIEEQKVQYRGLRQSIRLLDEKLAEIDERMAGAVARKEAAEQADGRLRNVHEEWLSPILEQAKKIAVGRLPQPEDLHEALAALIPTAGGVMFRRTPGTPPDVYAFVGPTGVGKTTTLAKLAAKCVLAEKLNVGLISLDTFRVAAVDQLREYASLLGVEVAVAFSGEELARQITNFTSKDVVFIDTPGRGPYDQAGIDSIAACLKGVDNAAVVLVVPAGIRKEDARSIMTHYGALCPSALIVTKTDESSVCDGLTTLFETAGKPVVYVTDGQRVPEDIHAASPGLLASIVMPDVSCNEPVNVGGDRNGGNSP
jgi:flagellar biosynthesis protein FlhF